MCVTLYGVSVPIIGRCEVVLGGENGGSERVLSICGHCYANMVRWKEK